MPDFYVTGDDYRFRFDAEAKERFIGLIRERFNSGVKCRGRVLKWDTVIDQKTIELGKFLVAKSSTINFAEPSLKLERTDSQELRTKILSLPSKDARSVGIGKSTLHYLRENSGSRGTFLIQDKTRKKLEALT